MFHSISGVEFLLTYLHTHIYIYTYIFLHYIFYNLSGICWHTVYARILERKGRIDIGRKQDDSVGFDILGNNIYTQKTTTNLCKTSTISKMISVENI